MQPQTNNLQAHSEPWLCAPGIDIHDTQFLSPGNTSQSDIFHFEQMKHTDDFTVDLSGVLPFGRATSVHSRQIQRLYVHMLRETSDPRKHPRMDWRRSCFNCCRFALLVCDNKATISDCSCLERLKVFTSRPIRITEVTSSVFRFELVYEVLTVREATNFKLVEG